MNYEKIYNNIIDRAKTRKISSEIYCEEHHVIPRCLGGTDEQTNLVRLTAREHFVVHQLLAKVHGGELITAACLMSGKGKYTSKEYSWLKQRFSSLMAELQTERMKIPEFRAKVFTEERRGKISVALSGKKRTEEHTKNHVQSRRDNGTYFMTEENKEKLSKRVSGEGNPMWGKDHTEEAKEKIREANRQKIECPHCGKTGGVAIMQRWHFDNCKLSPNYTPPPKMKRVSPSNETREKMSETWKKKKEEGFVSANKGKPQKKDCECPHCGIVCGEGQYSRWHGDNCKKKVDI